MSNAGIYRVFFNVADEDVDEAKKHLLGKPYVGKREAIVRGELVSLSVPPDDSWLCIDVSRITASPKDAGAMGFRRLIATYRQGG